MSEIVVEERCKRLSLAELQPGSSGTVTKLRVNGLLYRRLLDLGILEGAKIEATLASPAGDPVVFRVRGADIALRKADAALVEVAPGEASPANLDNTQATPAPACRVCRGCASAPPQEGEASPGSESALLVALAGNPNTGKSTVFNALTGLRQHVGNWPGKTVMRAEGRFTHRDQRFKLVDLPGTYSLLSTSVEEEVARDFVLFGKPDCMVVVTDATCLERNLNLVLQILQITPRVVVCVNLLDEAKRKGVTVDTAALAEHLGVPVVGTAARTGQGLVELQESVYGVATGSIETTPIELRYDAALESAVDELSPLVSAAFPGIPNPRWVAMRLIDGGDTRLMEEVRSGLLTTSSGQIGATSLPAGVPTTGIGRRRSTHPREYSE